MSDAVRRWAARADAAAVRQHHAELRAVVDLANVVAREPTTIGDVFLDLEARRALKARLDAAEDHRELMADVRKSVERGWWSTFKVLAAEAVGVRQVAGL